MNVARGHFGEQQIAEVKQLEEGQKQLKEQAYQQQQWKHSQQQDYYYSKAGRD